MEHKKTLYLISNAHLDPVWQWEWEEGAAAALSTFRCAADFCEEFDGYVFNHNEALLYRWVEEYEPALFARIQRLVKEGRWHIMGGWHLQPDCNLPSGESFIRQILSGREYFAEKFGQTPTTAINFDPFGHTRGLVQILKKCGFDSYLFCRPAAVKAGTLPEGPFVWEGYDGSTVLGQRMPDYGSPLGHAAQKIERYARERRTESDYDICLWGVGDHGGGASRGDLRAIAALKKELEKQDVLLLHATPEEFFARAQQEQAALQAKGEDFPRFACELNPSNIGCLTSQIRIKQKHRQLENMLYSTEKMMTQACEQRGLAWPAEELNEAAYDLLTVEFHDMLPGSSIQPAEEMSLRMLDHGLEILSRVRARAFYALAAGQPKAKEEQIPILVYNPHPWPIEGDFTCEMMLWDQNWEQNFSMPQVWQNGAKLPTQCEKEASNLPLDWRKRVTFHATLAPMQMNRFDCTYTKIAEKPTPVQAEAALYVFANPRMTATLDRVTGTLRSWVVDGVEYLRPGCCALDVMADSPDPWGMTVTGYPEKVGEFTVMDAVTGSIYSGVDGIIPPVRVVEDGDVRTVAECLLQYGDSRAVITYCFSKTQPSIEIGIRVQWAEIHKMLKLRIPSAFAAGKVLGQQAFGTEEYERLNLDELAVQRWCAVTDDTHALAVLNDFVGGLSAVPGTVWLSLLHGAAYTAHPIEERRILPQNRFSPHMEQGERLYRFCLLAGEAAALVPTLGRKADVFQEQPMAVSFFPDGRDADTTPALQPPVLVAGDSIQLSALKKAEDGNGYILRLYNPTAADAQTELTGSLLAAPVRVQFGKFEVVTLRLAAGAASPCTMMEQPL